MHASRLIMQGLQFRGARRETAKLVLFLSHVGGFAGSPPFRAGAGTSFHRLVKGAQANESKSRGKNKSGDAIA